MKSHKTKKEIKRVEKNLKVVLMLKIQNFYKCLTMQQEKISEDLK